ncbi:exonuclease II Exo2 [Mycoemilia scoparia]|uniref:5'-3' exoribonuclease 1 n=1 Tax=Mycoemilia scoparia TaxID=417184 RepID=A0A9W8DVB8_9FUNG|nr:exonuclease II Exo2 [Mycoemilia scoparia]
MGIPKYFRWLSERYPLASQLLTEVPEFDNLYLDMNGIIHNCSHPEGKSLSEPQIFINIFTYIDFIFTKIKPKKLFYMGIDGVAPRAKMNEQRGRRFRAASERQSDEDFDSNCITPGTEFMARLTEALRYFIVKKVTEDKNWHQPKIILSGHEVPGEGEHKIIDYIRKHRKPNERHCLYGLDADLIMLGLVSHEPHISLLREEVFRPAFVKVDSSNPYTQNFFLLNLSIIRGCIEKEFESMKPFDLERIIDDYVFINMLVGNDFLPTMPDLKIADGGLLLLMAAYRQIDPPRNGYLHDQGIINFEQFQKLLRVLSDFEVAAYHRIKFEGADFSKRKRGKKMGNQSKATKATPVQKKILSELRKFIDAGSSGLLIFPPPLGPKDCVFVESIAEDLNLKCYPEFDHDGHATMCVVFTSDASSEENSNSEVTERAASSEIAENDDGSETARPLDLDDEAKEAIERVLKNYENGWEPKEADDARGFYEWKARYYKEKMNIDYPIPSADEEFPPPPESIVPLCSDYIKTIQWVLRYYFTGIPSWTWFYPHHYAPRITDLCTNLEKYKVEKFQLDQPYRPFEQLMSVLPAKSRSLVPNAYRRLMVEMDSPIIDFYPEKFNTDLNGKKMPWEAIVLIDFVDSERLRAAMQPLHKMLLPEEQRRNEFGQTYIFVPQDPIDQDYPSPLPDLLPPVKQIACRMVPFVLEDPPTIPRGILPGTRKSDQLLAGFPSLDSLPHTAIFSFHKVRVFLQDSKNESLVINLNPLEERFPHSCINYEGEPPTINVEFAKTILSKKRVFVQWPYLRDARPVCVWDATARYFLNNKGLVQVIPHKESEKAKWRKDSSHEKARLDRNFAVTVEEPRVMIEAQMFDSMKVLTNGSRIRSYKEKTSMFLLDTTIINEGPWGEDSRYKEFPPISVTKKYPLGEQVIFLAGVKEYGRVGTVIGNDERKDVVSIRLEFPKTDPTLNLPRALLNKNPTEKYYPSHEITRRFRFNPLAFSKLTASLNVINSAGVRTNIGLNLKFESKGLKVIGYSRKADRGWEFSEKAVELFTKYYQTFPTVLDRLQKLATQSDYRVSDLFENDQQLMVVKRWLKENNKAHSKVTLDSNAMAAEPIAHIIQGIKESGSLKTTTAKISNIPREHILKPADAPYRLATQKFGLGDRVMYAMDRGGFAKLGDMGFVVGVKVDSETGFATLVDIVFDNPIVSGHDLDGRCPDYHGAVLQPWMLLNLTQRQVSPDNRPLPTTQKNTKSSGNVAGDVPNQRRVQQPMPQKPAPWANFKPSSKAPSDLPVNNGIPNKAPVDLVSAMVKLNIANNIVQNAMNNSNPQPRPSDSAEDKLRRLGLPVLPSATQASNQGLPDMNQANPQNAPNTEAERVQRFLNSINQKNMQQQQPQQLQHSEQHHHHSHHPHRGRGRGRGNGRGRGHGRGRGRGGRPNHHNTNDNA